MRQIHNTLSLLLLGTLFASISTIANADTLVRHVIAAGGGQIMAGGHTLGYTIGQPIISTDNTARLISGFWPLPKASGNVTLAATDITASSCKNFDVTIQVQAPNNQAVDTVAAYLNFDPTLLKVVKVKPATTLNVILNNQYDNATGQINFSAATSNQVLPKGTFDLMTITFRAKREAQTTLVFNTNGQRTTEVLLGANSVFAGADDLSFAVENLGTLVGRVANFKKHPLRVHVSPPTPEAFYEVTTDATGKFTLPDNLAADTYDIYVSASNTLQTKKTADVVACRTKSLYFGKLKAGDVIGVGFAPPDNRIGIYDFSIFRLYLWDGLIPRVDYNLDGVVNEADTETNFLNTHFDLNNDGVVNLDDADPIQANFAQTGDDKVGGPYLRRSPRDSKPTVPQFEVGNSFELTVSLQTGDNPIDAVAAQLSFDANLLRVNNITPSTAFDTLLQSQFNNETGQIEFAAGHLAKEALRGTIELMTIHVTVLGEGGEQTLTLNTTAVYGGQIVSDVTEQTPAKKVPPLELARATCQVYAVQDGGLNNSQFFAINHLNGVITPLGEVCQGCDVEAMDVHPVTNILYIASGNNTANHPKGYLYKLDAQTGQRVAVGPTGFDEISSLAFDAAGELWGWAKGHGLIKLDTTTGKGTLVFEYQGKVEDLTWSLDGTVLYGSIDTQLYAYKPATNEIELVCDNLPLETEALEILPETLLPDGFILLGMHQDNTLKLHAFDMEACEMVISHDIATPYNDVEGIAMPTAACQESKL
jgi:hypothetical protein